MTTTETFVLIGSFLGLLGVLSLAIGVITAVLIGEGEVKFADSAILLKDTKVDFGGPRDHG